MPMLVGLEAALPSLPPTLVHVHIGLDAVVVVVVMAVGVVIICNLKSFNFVPQNLERKKKETYCDKIDDPRSESPDPFSPM